MRLSKYNDNIQQPHKVRGNLVSPGRKGFVQIIEVAIAALLIVLALPIFFSGLNIKQDWARHDLIVSGNGIIHSLEASGNLSQIFNNTQELIRQIESIKPSNVKYSIYMDGTPKPNISLACISCSGAEFSYAQSNFTPTLLNGRFINFTIENVDLSLLSSIPEKYDVALFINYADADWIAQKQKISDYLASGKGIVAIQEASHIPDFLDIFNLSIAGGPVSGYHNFSRYSAVEKYFLGFGFDVATADDGTGTYKGTWYIWEIPKQINTTGVSVEIEGIGTKTEGETFSLGGAPDGNNYSFRVKKIWTDKSGVILHPMNKTFVFNDFWNPGENKVEGNNILSVQNVMVSYSLMTKNNTAVWISDFPNSDEYRALAKSAVASLAEKFYIVSPMNVKNYVNVNNFINFCCDAPETAKLTFSLWYVY